MARQIKGILVSRLIVLLTIILLPIVIFIIYNLVDFQLWYSNDPAWNFWIIKVLCPLIFSISWLFFLILFANRFATTLDSTDKVISVVPLRLQLFFGLNAIFILFIFVFPLITPVVSVLSFSSMAWRLTTRKKESWEDHETSFFTKFLMGVFSIPALFCAISIIPQYIVLAVFLWNEVWITLLDVILVISYCMCTALAIGSLFILIINSGVSEVEEIYTNKEKDRQIMYIRIFEILLFVFFLFLAYYDVAVIELFYNAGFIIVVFVSIVNYINGKRKSVRTHLLGYVLAAVFLGSNLLIFNVPLVESIQMWILIISAALFIFVFFYTFIKLEENVLDT